MTLASVLILLLCVLLIALAAFLFGFWFAGRYHAAVRYREEQAVNFYRQQMRNSYYVSESERSWNTHYAASVAPQTYEIPHSKEFERRLALDGRAAVAFKNPKRKG